MADFPEAASGPNLVNRENVRRKTGRPLQRHGPRPGRRGRGDRAEGQSSAFKLPEGYFIEFGGQFEAQRSATLRIAGLAGVSLAGIFVVLMMLYPSARITFQILNAIPTAFIGGVLALVLTRQTLTVASLVGFVSLGGIAVRNGILLVTHYFHLMKEEGEAFSQATILRGSLERLAPVLMTALTAGIGLIPLGRRRQEAGAGNPLPGGDGDPGRTGDLDVLRVPAPPRFVLEVQRQGCRAAGPERRLRGGAAARRVSTSM